MNIVDIIIIIWLLFGLTAGLKNGFTKQLISFVGFVLIFFLSYKFKNNLSVIMYEYLPFFNFDGAIKGVTVLNIALYEFLAFLAVFAILEILFGIVLFISDLVEKAMAFLIIPGAISHILGAVVGVIEYFLIAFVILYCLTLPIFNIKEVKDSQLTKEILEKTPLFSDTIEPTVEVINEFAELRDKYEITGTSNEFNLETLDLFLKHKVITLENVDKLIEKKKLQIDNVESVLSKYHTTTNE